MKGVLRREVHTTEELDTFHRDGFVVYPAILTDEATALLRTELLSVHQTRNADGPGCDESAARYVALSPEERVRVHGGHMFGPLRNWDAKGPVSDALMDPPLVMGFLEAVMGPKYNLCHSAMSITSRGGGGALTEDGVVSLHQDAGASLEDRLASYSSQLVQAQRYAEQRDDWYISTFYYVEGLQPGVASLSIVPGSHRLPPADHPEDLATRGSTLGAGVQNERMLALMEANGLTAQTLDLPPGSLIIHNSMCYHGVEPMPLDASNEHRIFADYIYKSWRYPKARTQPIPLSWLTSVRDDPERYARRKILFDRPMGSMYGTAYPLPEEDDCPMVHHAVASL